jgi:hypothetical protein
MVSWLGVSAMTLLAGCVVTEEGSEDDVLPGRVSIHWQVGPSGCEAAGVADIQVDIGGVGGTFACDDGGAEVSVPAGSYELELLGLDAGGFARYEGNAHNIVVNANQTVDVPTVVLSALPADVAVTWFFDNGKLCASNGVFEVEAILYDSDDFATEPVIANCDDGQLLISEVQPGPYVLSLLGRDDGGIVIYRGESQITLEKGDLATVDVELVAEQ